MNHHKSPLIMVIGATGTVGRSCVVYLLKQGFRVLATSRDPSRINIPDDLKNSYWNTVAFDIDQAGSLPVFHNEQPHIVINCSGPSYKTSENVLKYCLAASSVRVFVDVGGDEKLMNDYQTLCQQAGIVGVIGAGVQPGLSGLSIQAVAQQLGHTSNKEVVAYIGGLQSLTPAGLDEYLHAVTKRLSIPGQYWYNRTLQTLHQLTPLPPCFPTTATAHASIDEESIHIAKSENLLRLETYNVMDSPELESQIQASIGSQTPIETLNCAQLNACLLGRQPYFRISVSGHAQDNGQIRHYHVMSYCKDSYAASGQLAALAASWASEGKFTMGISWLSSITDPWHIWHSLTQANTTLHLNWDNKPLLYSEVETGSL